MRGKLDILKLFLQPLLSFLNLDNGVSDPKLIWDVIKDVGTKDLDNFFICIPSTRVSRVCQGDSQLTCSHVHVPLVGSLS